MYQGTVRLGSQLYSREELPSKATSASRTFSAGRFVKIAPLRQARTHESGVFLPLAAMVIAGVLSLFFAAGVDTMLVRLTRSELQNMANAICGSIAYDAVSPDRAAPSFRNGALALSPNLQFGSLTRALLVMALPEEGGLLKIPSDGNLCEARDAVQLAEVSAPPSNRVAIGKFNDFGLPPCNQGVPQLAFDCELFAYPGTGPQFIPTVPDSFMNALLPGQGLGCQLTASVNPFAPSHHPANVSAQAIYSTNSSEARRINSPSAPRGLRIAISTQLTTPPLEIPTPIPFPQLPSQPELLFDVQQEPFSWSAVVRRHPPAIDFARHYDPFCAPPNLGSSDWCRAYPVFGLPLAHLRAFSAARPIDHLDGPPTSPTALPPNYFRGGFELTENQRREHIIACMNPPVMIRNIIAETLVRLAALDPVLRRHTEILHINPLNHSLPSPIPIGSTPKTEVGWPINYATVLVPMGEDITARKFQLPFVHFRQDSFYDDSGARRYQGLNDLPDTTELQTYASSVYPFNDHSGLTEIQERIHAEIASQLRRCLHLYTRSDDGANENPPFRGVDVFATRSLVESEFGLRSASQIGAFSAPQEVYPGTGATRENGRYRGYPGNETLRVVAHTDLLGGSPPGKEFAQPQGHEFPWLNELLPTTPLNTERLSAAELVSVLGSSQRCPYSDIGAGTEIMCPSTGGSPEAFRKQTLYTSELSLDLIPDFTGLLLPLVDPENQPSPDGFIPLASPGQAIAPQEDRFPGERRLPTPPVSSSNLIRCQNSGLVILTHHLGQDEAHLPHTRTSVSTLFGEYAEKAGEDTPIMLIVVPTASTSFRLAERLRDFLLRISTKHKGISVLVLAPPQCVDLESGSEVSNTECADSDYHQYWGELFDPASPHHLSSFIRRFFQERLFEAPRRVL